MLAETGRHCLTLALLCAAWAGLAAFLGGGFGYPALFRSGRRALHAVTLLLAAAAAILVAANLSDDFRLRIVASYSNRTLGTLYKISAFWGSQAGSLLLWALVLAGFTSMILLQYHRRSDDQIPFAAGVLALIQLFFLAVLNFASHPFTLLETPPVDGNGLNPQLQTPLMVIHPPSLYLGYVGFSIPFAFAMAALMTGRLNDVWIHRTRRWTIFSWFFLGIGILLGAYWAYIELGWGGYWAWDPVENAALIPWLTGTAFLHSVMIQEKKRMLQVWNMVLVILTYCLCILGTFITRSGVISSVHSFTVSNLGPMFVTFLAFIFAASFLLLIYRLPELKSANRLESFVSRESSFLFNNLFLLACAFAVLWGTLFPILSEAVRGVKITVGPPFFNQVIAPIGLLLVFLTGVCPLIAWRRATLTHLARNFLLPVGTGLAGMAGLVVAGIREPYPVLAFSLCLFVFGTIGLEFARGTRARSHMTGEPMPLALVRLINRNRRRYGGYLVHLGFVLLVFGVAGSWNYQVERTASLRRGESMQIGRYALTFTDTFSRRLRNADQFGAALTVRSGDRVVGTLHPARNFYPPPQQPSTEVDIRSTLVEDLYLILLQYDPQTGVALFKALVNPLVNWIWIGGIVVIFGAHFAVLPDRRRERAWKTAEAMMVRPAASGGAVPVAAIRAAEGESRG